MYKPGHEPVRKLSDRDIFVQSLVQALKLSDKEKTGQSTKGHAKTAYRSLQFDYPDVRLDQLQALVKHVRKQSASGALPTTFLPTNKFIENLKLGGDPVPVTSDNPTPPVITTQTKLPPNTAPTTPSPTSPSATDSESTQPPQTNETTNTGTSTTEFSLVPDRSGDAPHVQQMFLELQGLLLVRCVAIALTSTPDKTPHFVSKLHPPPSDDAQPLSNDSDNLDAACMESGTGQASLDSQSTDASSMSQHPQKPTEHTTPKLASAMDSDDVEYEAIGVDTSTRNVESGTKNVDATTSTVCDAAKLAFLASHISVNLAECSSSWKEDDLVSETIKILTSQSLRLADAPAHMALQRTIMQLLVRRLLSTPTDLVHLQNILPALSRPLPPPPGSKPPKNCLVLPQSLILCAALSSQVFNTGTRDSAAARSAVRRSLWGYMSQAGILKACASALESLESGMSSGVSPDPRQVEALDTVCKVLEFYIMEAPGGTKSSALQQSRALRPLVNLFANWGGLADCNALRRTALLACASSKETCTWFSGCAPARNTALQHSSFVSEGSAESHGALWPLVLTLSKNTAKCSPSDSVLLCDLLHRTCNITHLSLFHTTLQLVDAIHAVSQGRIHWPPEVHSVLREAMPTLQAMAHPAKLANEVSGNGTAIMKDSESKPEHTPDAVGTEPLVHKAMALAPQCILWIKALTAQQGTSAKLD